MLETAAASALEAGHEITVLLILLRKGTHVACQVSRDERPQSRAKALCDVGDAHGGSPLLFGHNASHKGLAGGDIHLCGYGRGSGFGYISGV